MAVRQAPTPRRPQVPHIVPAAARVALSRLTVGEDAASVRSYFPGGKITIKNSEGHKAAEKMFQFNAPCDVHIENFQGSDMGKLVRQNGGTEFEQHIDLNEVNISGVISAVVQSDSPLCYIRHHALSYMFKGSGDKSDRVFRMFRRRT